MIVRICRFTSLSQYFVPPRETNTGYRVQDLERRLLVSLQLAKPGSSGGYSAWQWMNNSVRNKRCMSKKYRIGFAVFFPTTQERIVGLVTRQCPLGFTGQVQVARPVAARLLQHNYSVPVVYKAVPVNHRPPFAA